MCVFVCVRGEHYLRGEKKREEYQPEPRQSRHVPSQAGPPVGPGGPAEDSSRSSSPLPSLPVRPLPPRRRTEDGRRESPLRSQCVGGRPARPQGFPAVTRAARNTVDQFVGCHGCELGTRSGPAVPPADEAGQTHW